MDVFIGVMVGVKEEYVNLRMRDNMEFGKGFSFRDLEIVLLLFLVVMRCGDGFMLIKYIID